MSGTLPAQPTLLASSSTPCFPNSPGPSTWMQMWWCWGTLPRSGGDWQRARSCWWPCQGGSLCSHTVVQLCVNQALVWFIVFTCLPWQVFSELWWHVLREGETAVPAEVSTSSTKTNQSKHCIWHHECQMQCSLFHC